MNNSCLGFHLFISLTAKLVYLMPLEATAATGRVPREALGAVRDRLVTWAYLLGWRVVCRVPRPWAEWVFRQIADWLWRRQGPAVRQLEANLSRVARAAPPDTPGADLRQLSRQGMRSYLRYWLE